MKQQKQGDAKASVVPWTPDLVIILKRALHWIGPLSRGLEYIAMLIERIATGVRDALRLAIVTLFCYLLYATMERYLKEPILTRVKRYPLPSPNITICPSNVETFTVNNDPMQSWLWAVGREKSVDLIKRYGSDLYNDTTFCVGGAGVQPYRCAKGGRGLAHWKSRIYPPGFVCHTLLVNSEFEDSMNIALFLGSRWMSPSNISRFVMHAGDSAILQPGQFTRSISLVDIPADKAIDASVTFREFKRTNVRRLPCISNPTYNREQCSIDCRWARAATEEGCRGSWQTDVAVPICQTEQDISSLHKTFLGITESICQSCYNPCLHRNYLIVDLFYRRDIEASDTKILTLQLESYATQVQEFGGYTGEDLMSDIGSSIGLLLGLSMFTVISIVERSIRSLMQSYYETRQPQAETSQTKRQTPKKVRRVSIMAESRTNSTVKDAATIHDKQSHSDNNQNPPINTPINK